MVMCKAGANKGRARMRPNRCAIRAFPQVGATAASSDKPLWAHFVWNEMRRTKCAAKCADLQYVQRRQRHPLRHSASRSAQSLRD